MKRVFWFFMVLPLLAVATWQSNAAGLIIVHDEEFWRGPRRIGPLPTPHHPPRPLPPPRPRPPRPPIWRSLELALTKADAKIKDQIATTFVEQEFYNPNDRQLEGTFLFPVPKGAHIDKFTLEINGRQTEAELLSADKARGIYEEIVRNLRDPALLEYVGQDLFKARIFPIEPRSHKRITLSYSHLLKSDAGLVSYVLPLNTEKFCAQPIGTLSVKVTLESKRPLKSIYSPSHSVEVRRSGENRATLGFEGSQVRADRDFQLYFAQEEGEFGLNLLTHRESGEDGFFLMLVSPGAETKSTRIIPKDVAFVLDTSGSMAGAKLDQAKKALRFCVANLNEEDRFEVLRFATETEPLFDQLMKATREHCDRAEAFIKNLKPIGGTAIDEALQKALSLRPEKSDRPYVIIFLTDGRPTVGNTDENQIVASATRHARELTRIFCFGIGTDVNTHLLDKITEDTHAYSQYVLPEEDIEVKVSSFFTRIKEPVLTGPKIKFPDGIRVTQMYPSPLPDLFKSEQLVLAGRYSGRGKGRIAINGSVAGEQHHFTYAANFPERSADHDFIPRLWATRRVGYLLDEIRLRGESSELKDEVTQLARQYNIVTPYTAYLIVEDETRRGVAQNVRTLQLGEEMQRQLGQDFQQMNRDRSGNFAVGGARAAQKLKMAENAPAAVAESRSEVVRSQVYAFQDSAAQPGAGNWLVPADAFKPNSREIDLDRVREHSEAQAQQNRFVAGRTFYQNGNQWIDSEIQNAINAQLNRIQFGTDAYFALLKKHPQMAPWLSLGQNVQFVLAGEIYEIYE